MNDVGSKRQLLVIFYAISMLCLPEQRFCPFPFHKATEPMQSKETPAETKYYSVSSPKFF